ncbi:MAG: hypothetical protein QM778_33290 [Myxococcales bacterium]
MLFKNFGRDHDEDCRPVTSARALERVNAALAPLGLRAFADAGTKQPLTVITLDGRNEASAAHLSELVRELGVLGAREVLDGEASV